MKPLYQAFIVGFCIASCHALILARGWTLWDVSIVSVSSLSAGVFFILGMIFRSTVQDYKSADIAITQCRGKLLSMQDLNGIAAAELPGYDPGPFHGALRRAAAALSGYVENGTTLAYVHACLSGLITSSQELRRTLPGAQANLLLKQHEDIRMHLSYLAYLKDHNFPRVGYVFLWFFAAFILVLQLFSASQNHLLNILFIFSLGAVLVFFIAFIHDLDHPFRCRLACFMLDTRPLKNVLELLAEDYCTHAVPVSAIRALTERRRHVPAVRSLAKKMELATR